MEHVATISQPDADAPRWRADRLRTRWPGVRIDSVYTEPCGAGRRVRAVVRLGDLAPADVRVALTPAARSATLLADAAGADAERMWSCESYDNGCFVFERVLAPGDEAGEWIVLVRPAEDLIGRPVLYPLHLGDAARTSTTTDRGSTR